jgi:hypothetical protein
VLHSHLASNPATAQHMHRGTVRHLGMALWQQQDVSSMLDVPCTVAEICVWHYNRSRCTGSLVLLGDPPLSLCLMACGRCTHLSR